MGEPVKNWSMPSAIEQIEKCGFECEGGPLANNDAWQWLLQALKGGPQLLPGQTVWYEVRAEALGVAMSKWTRFYVMSVRASSDSERRTWEYDIITQLPDAYYTGGHVVKNVAFKDLRLVAPTPDQGDAA